MTTNYIVLNYNGIIGLSDKSCHVYLTISQVAFANLCVNIGCGHNISTVFICTCLEHIFTYCLDFSTCTLQPQFAVARFLLNCIMSHCMQANGLDERFNQTIQSMLVKYARKRKQCWEDHLDECIYAYNTARQASSCYTPFQLMFARKAVLPIDLEMERAPAVDALMECLPQPQPGTAHNFTVKFIVIPILVIFILADNF